MAVVVGCLGLLGSARCALCAQSKAESSFSEEHISRHENYQLTSTETRSFCTVRPASQREPRGGSPLFFLAVGSLFAGVVHGKNSEEDNAPKQGLKRRRRPEERGLPDDEALCDLAWTYLEAQHRLWPELAQQGVLPPLTKIAATRSARQFKDRFLDEFDLELSELPESDSWDALAAAYLRYSCDKSNPRSLCQQLELILNRAQGNKHFIPWRFVFADAAVTGTTSNRRGYELAKEALADADMKIEILYLDEIGRASRDSVESLRLGQTLQRLRKRLIGVSDGFDSRSEMSKMMLSMFAMLQEWFIDQLRSKVNRGMSDSHERGTNRRPPPFGNKLVPAVDSHGNPLYGRDGDRLNMQVVNEDEAPHVRLAFTLFVDNQWSMTRIARELRELRPDGRHWDSSGIRDLLERHKYIGIDVENMTYREKVIGENGKEKFITRDRPRSEWKVKRARHLQIISYRLWKQAQVRLAEVSEAFATKRKPTKHRSEVYSSVLVRPICGDCKRPMSLGRSGKYATFTCLNGTTGKFGCKHHGYKSVRIVESTILNHVMNNILNDEQLKLLVIRANEYLTVETEKPRTDTSAWKAEIRKLSSKQRRLAGILAEVGEEDLDSIVTELRRCERRLRELRKLISDAESSDFVPPPIKSDDAIALLNDLRELLRADVGKSAKILKRITGPIVIRQEQEEGKKKLTWIAEFTVNLVPVVAKLAAAGNCPSTRGWEYLTTHDWTIPEMVTLRVERPPNYEKLLPKFVEMHADGASIQQIAYEHKMCWRYAAEILLFGETGKKPCWGPNADLERHCAGWSQFKEVSSVVARLRDRRKLYWPNIVVHLHKHDGIEIAELTAMRAYDYAHRAENRASSGAGESRRRTRLGEDKYEEVMRLIGQNRCSDREIARRFGCSRSTVGRWRRKCNSIQPNRRKP